ncbi:SusC/RagA family TonB-linked outer membrane protein [Sphingobacterium spiritivorum]|uniref:SusC/RagA family TonB-linked outer membrane protein n=1 Tax=Sphingobacterium spiritivorum TaxID=258 RepID=UPI003DA2678D
MKSRLLSERYQHRLYWKLLMLSPTLIFALPNQSFASKVKTETNFYSVASQSTLSGTVKDEGGNPLSGVTVTEKGTQNSASTNNEGKFELKVTSGSAILVFTFIGYETIELPASAVASVVMKSANEALEEVVIVGYGAQKKSDLTGSIATVSSKSLENINSPNIVDKLQGKVSGLNINTGNARPGTTASLSIRGENSISASNDPLIILDGIPFSGSLGDIASNTIENISVLKDASSTAIYGSRAANGVILITSKKGMAGKPRMSYNGYFGVQNVERRLDLMNGAEYIQFMRDYQISKGKTGDQLNPENYLFANVLQQYRKGEEVDWQNVIFNDNAAVHEHQLSFSGGSDKSDYYASVAYLNQDGLVKNTPFERFNLNLNLNQHLTSWLKLGLAVQASQGKRNGVQPSIDNAVKMSPYGINRDENGNIVTYPMYAQTLYPHPFADENGINDDIKRTVYANTFLDIRLPVKGLSFKTTFGTNYQNLEQSYYYGSNTLNGMGVRGKGEIYNNNKYDWTWENLLTYDRSFGDHKLNIVGLYSASESQEKWSRLYGEDFVADVGYNNLGSAAKNQKITSGLTNTALISYMGRINYGYKERYLLTLTGRSDGYSAFSKNDKYAFFPSVAGAWVISKEDFFTSELINTLKLRASYGKNGNQAVSPYQTYNRLSKIDYLFGDGATVSNGLIMNYNGRGSTNLKWETTNSLNVGVDFGIWNDRISGNIDFYKAKTSDLLMSRQVPVMNGYNTIMSNIGQTENVGIEVGLNTKNIVKDDFTWSSSINFAYNKNKIVELRGDGKDDLTNAWLIGQPIRVFYDYKVIGVWQKEDDIANSHQPAAKPGDAKLADINGDGKITAADRTVMGNKVPVYTLGFGNEFTYKKFSLSVFMNGAFDVTKEDNFKNIERFLPNNGANYLADMAYWTPERPSNDIPSPGYTPVNNHSYYLNASYWRIRDVSLGYTFSGERLERLNIGSVRAFINGRNLYTFTNVKGFNPEALNVSTVTGNPTNTNILSPYPSARTFSLGVNVQF